MVRIKLSPSKIEKYRQYNEGEYHDTITKQKLIDTLTGKDVWTPRAEFGTAFHLVLQFGAAKYFNKGTGLYHIVDDDMPGEVVCDFSEIKLADDYHKANQDIVWETWHTHPHIMEQYHVFIQMRLDGIKGFRLKEHKTTGSTFDYPFYQRSMQWRIYLLATTAPMLDYEVFPYKEPADLAEGKTRRAGARDKREVSHETFTFYPYDGLVRDLNVNIRGLIHFCEVNGLMDYILDKHVPKAVV